MLRLKVSDLQPLGQTSYTLARWATFQNKRFLRGREFSKDQEVLAVKSCRQLLDQGECCLLVEDLDTWTLWLCRPQVTEGTLPPQGVGVA